jgi:hypothetical protein
MGDPQCSRPAHSSAHHFVLQASNLIFSYLCVLQGPPELGEKKNCNFFFLRLPNSSNYYCTEEAIIWSFAWDIIVVDSELPLFQMRQNLAS